MGCTYWNTLLKKTAQSILSMCAISIFTVGFLNSVLDYIINSQKRTGDISVHKRMNYLAASTRTYCAAVWALKSPPLFFSNSHNLHYACISINCICFVCRDIRYASQSKCNSICKKNSLVCNHHAGSRACTYVFKVYGFKFHCSTNLTLWIQLCD